MAWNLQALFFSFSMLKAEYLTFCIKYMLPGHFFKCCFNSYYEDWENNYKHVGSTLDVMLINIRCNAQNQVHHYKVNNFR